VNLPAFRTGICATSLAECGITHMSCISSCVSWVFRCAVRP
jgi:hypothetical protein